MSDQNSDSSALLAHLQERVKALTMCFNDCNEARIKAQNEVDEQEQEIADLNREMVWLKLQRDNAIAGRGYPPVKGTAWSRIGNWIKRLAK